MTTRRQDASTVPERPPGLRTLRSVWQAGVHNPISLVLLASIRAYQLTVSPLLGPVCRFYPSCSRYGYEAITVHGALRGSWLTARRLVRCHPWNPGGVDLVPQRRKAARAAPSVPPCSARPSATAPQGARP